MINTIELLSPARDLICGMAAIDHGADAVYIGANKFGARASAGNSIDDIEKLCQYAHPFGAKVYVTVNTIIYDDEIQETVDLVKRLETIGVDAILLQDLGLLQTLRENGVNITVHASTQTDNRTIEKVKWLASLGVKRVVLARELSIQEITDIHNAVPDIELEVFVHGALCVSYSGQCYASQYCFNRSANRGECAQFCRMAFELIDSDNNVIVPSCHILSLRDMAQLDNLERLIKAGAISFKIEGRLKDIDYVKNVTAAYNERLNEICRVNKQYHRASMGQCAYTFRPDIKKSFNRGFTTYFADGRQEEIASWNTPKAIGEPVGRVKEIRGNMFTVSTTIQFSNGDGLCFFNKKKQLIGFRVNKVECNKLYPLTLPKDLTAGTILYRNHDQAFETLLNKQSASRKIEVDMTLVVNEHNISLTITDEDNNTYTTTLPYSMQEAITPQEANIKKQLTKIGNTIYTCKNIDIHSNGSIPFVANSILTGLRRTAIDGLNALKNRRHTSTHQNKEKDIAVPVPQYDMPYYYNAANRKAQSFYAGNDIHATAFEINGAHTKGQILMQCRYCIKAEMGLCSKKNHGSRLKEPLQIRLADGRQFTLKFNCKKCEMEVIV